MPMVWNEQADAKLLSAIIQVYDVKVSGVKLNEVAELMGSECTAKALTHRLAKIKSLAKAGPGENGTQDAGAEKKATKTSKATKATAKATKKNGNEGKKQALARTQSPDGNGDVYLTPPDTTRPKRAGPKRDYAAMNGEEENEDDGLGAKIKIEVGEDIGEGLRQGPDDEG